MITSPSVSPVGDDVADDAAREYATDPTYRAHADALAPYRVIASAVILARSRRHITQRQLAEALSTTASAISRIESGEHPVSFETVSKLGAALGIRFVVGSAPGGSHAPVVVPRPDIALLRPAPRRSRRVGRPGAATRPRPGAASEKEIITVDALR